MGVGAPLHGAQDARDAVQKPAKAYQVMAHLKRRGYAPRWWVSELPREGGKDWGWTDDASKARLLSPYWQRRFMAYGRACSWRTFGLVEA